MQAAFTGVSAHPHLANSHGSCPGVFRLGAEVVTPGEGGSWWDGQEFKRWREEREHSKVSAVCVGTRSQPLLYSIHKLSGLNTEARLSPGGKGHHLTLRGGKIKLGLPWGTSVPLVIPQVQVHFCVSNIVLSSSFGFPVPMNVTTETQPLKPKVSALSLTSAPSLLASSPLAFPMELPLWIAPHVSTVLDFPLHMCPLPVPLINAKRQKQCQCPSADEWMNKMCQIHTIEYYSSMKKEKVLTHASTWMGLENTMLSEQSQTPKVTYYIFHIYKIMRQKHISGCQGQGKGEDEKWLLNGYRVSLWGDETFRN